jgi:hypothetical protein
MGKVLLIIFAVVGGLVFAFGVLGLTLALTQPDANQSDEVVGSIFFMVIGAVVAAPCIFFAFWIGRRRSAPWIPAGSSTSLDPAADLQQRYLGWFSWCQQALGGDAISLHSAAMAAMTSGTQADSATAAASAEAVRQSARVAASGAMAAAPKPDKVKTLARIGASTLGLLEPSERVVVSFAGQNRSLGIQAWGLAFGAIGRMAAASQTGAVFVTVTDHRVIALIGGQYGGLANRIGLIEPRSTVSAKFRKGLFGTGSFSLKGLGGASASMSVARNWLPEAQAAIELLAPSVGQVGAVGVLR